jgi:hypothetical protein
VNPPDAAGRLRQPVVGAVDEGGVGAAPGEGRDGRPGRAGDRDDRPAAAAAQELVAEPQGRVAPDDDQTRGLGAREEADLAALDDAVRHRPGIARGQGGERGGAEARAHPAGDDGIAVAQGLAEDRPRLRRRLAEQRLDRLAQDAGDAERGVDGRRVAAGLRAGHELAADPRPLGELGLREARPLPGAAQSCAGHAMILS